MSGEILQEISMSKLWNMLLLGGYSFLVLPAIVLMVAAFFDRSQNPEQPSRGKLLAFLALTAMVLALLGLLIWFNPYGTEINSSLPAFGVLVVLVALLVYVAYNLHALVGLWASEKTLASLFALIYLGLFISLALADMFAFYGAVVLTLIFASILYLYRTGTFFLGILSLLAVAAIIFTTGGWVDIPSADSPPWSRTMLSVATMISMLLSILLPAGLLVTSLRVPAPKKKPGLFWSLILSAILLVGAAYQIFWDGIWSSAHARAYEDHLPFMHFLLSLTAGVLLTIMLSGYRKLVGPVYTILVTVVTVLALSWGWNVSAFEMTERRAANVNAAITAYKQDHGVYPASLAELIPRYLLVLSPPVVVRTGGWCYQSTGDAYRLGYISGDFTYFKQDFKIETYTRTGDLPAQPWACDELLARFQAKELTY
jgi:hypothetical protein